MLKSQGHEEVKQHIVYDGGLIKYIFTAPIDLPVGAPCMVVEYKYVTGTTRVRDMQERVSNAGWQAGWGTDFDFDPNTVYDADGDGTL